MAVLLPGTASDEVGIFSAVRVNTSTSTFLARFGDLGVFQHRAAVRLAGAVSSPPAASDFDPLPIPGSDVLALATCRLGSCAVKLPVSVLEGRPPADSAVSVAPAPAPELFWPSESFGLRDVLELNALTPRETGRTDIPAIVVYVARYRLDTSLGFLQRRELEGHLRAYAIELITTEKAGLEGT